MELGPNVTKLLEENILACPVPKCWGDVKPTEDRKYLKCVQCNRKYPIEDDIPVMLIEEAVFDPGEEPKTA